MSDEVVMTSYTLYLFPILTVRLENGDTYVDSKHGSVGTLGIKHTNTYSSWLSYSIVLLDYALVQNLTNLGCDLLHWL
jgi:hypothetical protein